jgi:hypothetical protein
VKEIGTELKILVGAQEADFDKRIETVCLILVLFQGWITAS